MAKDKEYMVRLTANVKGWIKGMAAAITSTKKLNKGYLKAMVAAMTSTNKFNKSIKVGAKGFGDNVNTMSKKSAKLKNTFNTS